MKTAITGGIGSGKSYVCRLLNKQGIDIYDCDAAAKRLMHSSAELRRQLTQLIGPETYLADGRLNKAVVAAFLLSSEEHAKAVDFLLVEYNNGEVRPLTEPISATCYRTGCTILLHYSKGRLTADVTTATPRPAGSPLPHEVHLSAKVRKNRFGGIHIQHTGSCGESTTMLHRLKAEW